jgi:hypothetical protein
MRDTVMKFMKESDRQFEVSILSAIDPPQTILKTGLAARDQGERILEVLSILEKNR